MPRDRRLNFAAGAWRRTAHNRLVNLLRFPSRELLRQRQMRRVVFCNDYAPACVLVKTMNDSRARHASNAAQLTRAVRQQRIHQSPSRMSWRRMHHHARWLVDHQQVVIFKKYIQRNLLRLRLGGFRFRPPDGNRLARPGFVGGLDTFGVNKNAPLLDQPLDGAARNPSNFPRRNVSRRCRGNELSTTIVSVLGAGLVIPWMAPARCPPCAFCCPPPVSTKPATTTPLRCRSRYRLH